MTQPYPIDLRSIIRTAKSRSQPASFSVSEPRRGMAYVRQIGTDIPVFWDVQFRFTTTEAQLFQLWFVTVINRGADEFTMPIRTEFGNLTHTCRFLPDSLLPVTESGDTWGYTATIMARAQLFQSGVEEAGPIIVALGLDWLTDAALIDQAMNAEVPSA